MQILTENITGIKLRERAERHTHAHGVDTDTFLGVQFLKDKWREHVRGIEHAAAAPRDRLPANENIRRRRFQLHQHAVEILKDGETADLAVFAGIEARVEIRGAILPGIDIGERQTIAEQHRVLHARREIISRVHSKPIAVTPGKLETQAIVDRAQIRRLRQNLRPGIIRQMKDDEKALVLAREFHGLLATRRHWRHTQQSRDQQQRERRRPTSHRASPHPQSIRL